MFFKALETRKFGNSSESFCILDRIEGHGLPISTCLLKSQIRPFEKGVTGEEIYHYDVLARSLFQVHIVNPCFEKRFVEVSSHKPTRTITINLVQFI